MYSIPPVASKCLLNGPVGNGRNVSSGESPHSTHGLMQLCVIVEKDEIGYGLTVSGDKPVHVQSVKENGASARAGVRTGDRIYKVNGSLVANFDHTEVVNLIKAGSHVALTLLRKPEREHHRLSRTPASPGGVSASSSKSAGSFSSASARSSVGSDRITHPIPADAQQEQQAAKERIDTFRKMLDEAVAVENKLQQEFNRSKSSKVEAKLQDAKKTTGSIRKQLDSLTAGSFDMRLTSNRNSVCLGDISSSSSEHTHSPAASLPASVDSPDSSIVRPSTASASIDEFHGSITTSPASDTDEEPGSYSRANSGEHRNSIGFGRPSHNPSSEIFSMDDDDFSPESQTVVKDHGPFIDFELLRDKHAHCSVFLSFLVSNADPAPLLFTLVSDLYMNGTAKDMRRWAYEIHSTFILKDAPLAIKLEDGVIETIEFTLKTGLEKEEPWKNLFIKARASAAEDIATSLADFRLKRELGLGNLFGDGDLRDNIEKSVELRIIEKTLKPHYEKYANDESPRSLAMSLSLATVMKEWGVHRGGIDRQLSFAMKDLAKTSSLKAVLKFSKKQKETKNHHLFTPHMFQTTTFCDHCNSLIWGIGYQGYICSNCEMNIHKECFGQVETCSKKKKKKRSSIIPKQMKSSGNSTSSAAMLSDEYRDVPSVAADEEPTVQSAGKEEKQEVSSPFSTNGERPKSNIVGRSESFNKKTDSIKSKDSRRAKSDVDKDGGEKILTAIDQSRSSSSASSLSIRSDSSSTERVNDLSMKPAPIDEEGDSDFEVEESMPSLDVVIKKEQLRKMKPKDKKRQEVINELLYTERSHVRNLKLLDKLFHQPMAQADFLSKELVELVFPGIQQLIEAHVQLNNELKSKMKLDPLVSTKDVASILLHRFDGEAGEKMKEICALFCRNHTYALNALKERRKKDIKLQELMTAAETNPMCRRLQFKDLIIIEVHRLTKYPLLIDSMYNNTTSQSEEYKMLARVSKCSRAVLEHVNHAVKECENHHKLVALQKRLDTKPIQNSDNPLVADYKNLNLQDYKLVYEGALTWRLSTNRAKQIDLHVVLLENMLVLLQVQDDGKLVLKCQSQIATQAREDSKFGHSPIITLNSMLVRQVATDKKAIFIINTSQLGPQIYDLVAHSIEEKKRWFKYISEAADNQKKSHSTMRPRVPVNKDKLTLADTSTDEAPVPQEKFTDSYTPDAIKTNITAPGAFDLPTFTETAVSLNDSDDRSSRMDKESEDGDVCLETESEVSTCETTLQDEDGERDPKSLVLASISDTMLLKQILSNAASATVLLNTAPLPASMPDMSPTPAANEQSILVLNSLSRRLNSLLELVQERDNERLQLQHQLHTADQLLKHSTSKELLNSRPNSFVSNSSSNTSAGEPSDPQINAITQIPVIPPVIQIERLHSDPPVEPTLNDSASSSSLQADSGSDDEGTVYAEPKYDINETSGETSSQQRPDSSLSDISNTHTDNTLISNDYLSDDFLEANVKQSSSVSDTTSDYVTAPSSTLNAATSAKLDDSLQDVSSSSNSEYESDADKGPDITAQLVEAEVVETNMDDRDGSAVGDGTLIIAARLVERAIKSAMNIITGGNELGDTSISNVNSHDINLECVSDSEVNVESGGGEAGGVVLVDEASDAIDDSDEADALSASSLD